MTLRLPYLHAVTNDAVLSLPDFVDRAGLVARCGRTAIHIRSDSMDGLHLRDKAEAVMRICAGTSSTVFVNDRADVAKAIGADGVHLPSAGLSVEQVRSIVGPGVWVGRSAHNTADVIRATDEGADYVFLGPIWHTPSHPDRPALGAQALTEISNIPVIALGGVTPERVADCLANGAYGVAAISALWDATDIGSATQRFSLSFQT